MPAIHPRATLAAALLLLAPSSARAQVAPPAAVAVASADSMSAFVVLVGGDTLGVERFVHTPERLVGELALRGQPRVVYDIALDGPGRTRHMALSVHAPGASPQTPPVQRLLLRPAGDSVAVDVASGGNPPRTQRMGMAPGAVLALGNAFATLELVVDRARAAGGDSVQVPVFLASGGQQVTTTVRLVSADSAVLAIGGVEVHFAARDGRTIRVTVPAQSVVATRVDGPAAATVALDRPDYTASAGAPYTAQGVRIPTAAGDTLAGTLTMPGERRGRRAPAVITITGSGAQDRGEALTILPGYRPFRQIADTLGRRGVAVLRLDDRGYGASTGTFTAATSADFAADVRAALAWLRARPDVDPARIFLLGHSEGAMIAPMVAADDRRLAGIVLLAGPSWTGRRTLDYQIRYAVEQDSTIAPAVRAGAVAARLAALDSLIAKQPWLRYFADHDPLAVAARVRVPALLVQGATDRQVPAEQAEELAAALRKGGATDVTVRILPDRNHLLLPDRDGNPAGYGGLTQRQLGADVLGPIVDWIVKRASIGGA
ncbi:MAG: alpha/beta hydrolase family protein [Gemmatimonadaceae bacterium]